MTDDPSAVAIFGCGPAGLLAAHAVSLTGKTPIVFATEAEKSKIAGATYLHEPIPDITSAAPDGTVRFVKVGTKSGYALKVYGDATAPCSWDRFDEQPKPCWSLQAVYDDLWELYSEKIVPSRIGAAEAKDMIDTFPLVISTIPAHCLCYDPTHKFLSREIWIRDDWPGTAGGEQYLDDDNVIVYDGRVGAIGDRYRYSRIFGHFSTEYRREVPGAVRGIKPLPTTCDCFPEIVRAGRWGEWKPGVLVNHAFSKVWNGLFDEFEGS